MSTAAKPAEYKQVTVLFADVVHSMDIAAAVGAERLREIMTGLVSRCASVVQRYGGTVDKFTGDGIMAVFGAPTALEDHALRACLVALGIQKEVTHLAAEVERRDGVDLQLRVGLNSGQVIAGEIGSGALGYTALGEQVGMAQRMESVAPPGGVMLSASTARLVEGVAVLGESELVQIKGANAPLPARRLLGMGEGHRAAGPASQRMALPDLFYFRYPSIVSDSCSCGARSRAIGDPVSLSPGVGITACDLGRFAHHAAVVPSYFRGEQRPGELSFMAPRQFHGQRCHSGL